MSKGPSRAAAKRRELGFDITVLAHLTRGHITSRRRDLGREEVVVGTRIAPTLDVVRHQFAQHLSSVAIDRLYFREKRRSEFRIQIDGQRLVGHVQPFPKTC